MPLTDKEKNARRRANIKKIEAENPPKKVVRKGKEFELISTGQKTKNNSKAGMPGSRMSSLTIFKKTRSPLALATFLLDDAIEQYQKLKRDAEAKPSEILASRKQIEALSQACEEAEAKEEAIQEKEKAEQSVEKETFQTVLQSLQFIFDNAKATSDRVQKELEKQEKEEEQEKREKEQKENNANNVEA